jgi:hypothetical protein
MRIFNTIPEQVNLDHLQFLEWLGESAIISAGKGDPSIIITCLMHGNEPSGFFAIHKLLQQLHKKDFLKKRVHFLFLNVRAALTAPIFYKRHCDDESDMNRIWGKDGINTEQNNTVKEFMDFIEKQKPELLIDFHNTAGHNPVFTIATKIEEDHLKACSYFSSTLWHSTPRHSIIDWTDQFCTSISVECGRNIDPESHDNADNILKRALVLGKAIEGELEHASTLKMLYEPSLVEVHTKDIAFAEKNTGQDIVFRPDLDSMNTVHIPKDTFLGFENKSGSITHPAIEVVNNRIITNQDCTFSMMTNVVDVILKDTLGYVVKTKEGSISSLIEHLS